MCLPPYVYFSSPESDDSPGGVQVSAKVNELGAFSVVLPARQWNVSFFTRDRPLMVSGSTPLLRDFNSADAGTLDLSFATAPVCGQVTVRGKPAETYTFLCLSEACAVITPDGCGAHQPGTVLRGRVGEDYDVDGVWAATEGGDDHRHWQRARTGFQLGGPLNVKADVKPRAVSGSVRVNGVALPDGTAKLAFRAPAHGHLKEWAEIGADEPGSFRVLLLEGNAYDVTISFSDVAERFVRPGAQARLVMPGFLVGPNNRLDLDLKVVTVSGLVAAGTQVAFCKPAPLASRVAGWGEAIGLEECFFLELAPSTKRYTARMLAGDYEVFLMNDDGSVRVPDH